MNSVEAALRRVTADLDRRRLGWALVGGFAVSARAEPRFTRDVDVAVAVIDDRAAEQNVHDLVAGGYRLLASVEQEAVGRLATVRLSPVAGDVVVDVLFASSGIEPEIVRSAEAIEILPGLVVPVARTGHLIALKLLARDDESRPQDLADLRSLHEVATREDVDLARSAIHLITERGYHRGLAAALTALLSP
ncbi:MAG: nucleotidyl transferase AbiEii/AbiGii toxin family protein [Geodermatophilaceae bacterium]